MGFRLGCETRWREFFLDPFHAESGLAGGGQGDHLATLFETGDRPLGFVRRDVTRQEPDFLKPRLLAAAFRENQVPEVNRIEGAAEQADAHDVSRLPKFANDDQNLCCRQIVSNSKMEPSTPN